MQHPKDSCPTAQLQLLAKVVFPVDNLADLIEFLDPERQTSGVFACSPDVIAAWDEQRRAG